MDKPDKGRAEIENLEWDAAFFHCIADQACDAILGIRLDGRICYANLHATTLYGYTRDELCGMSVRTLRATETLADYEELFRRAAGGGIMFRTTHRRKDGRTFPVEVNSRGVELPDGRIVVSVIRDNTPHEQLTQELQAARTISDCLLRAANVIVVILDCAGRIRFFNETAQRITGYTCVDATERVRAEELLQKKETFISSVVEGLQFPFFVVDRQYRYMAYNEAHRQDMKNLFGANIEPDGDLLAYHKDSRKRALAKQHINQALAGIPVTVEAIIGEKQL